jgi:hypothetical protein
MRFLICSNSERVGALHCSIRKPRSAVVRATTPEPSNFGERSAKLVRFRWIETASVADPSSANNPIEARRKTEGVWLILALITWWVN